MTTAAIAAVSQEVVCRTVALKLDFASGAVRLNGSPADISFVDVAGGSAQVFTGIGGLGAITAVQESNELRSYDCTFTLSGIPRDAIGLALTEPYQRRAATVWDVLLDPTTWQPIGDPVIVFRGHMDQMNPTLGQSATVSVRMVNRLADWENARMSRYTDQEQQRLHPGDTGFRFVVATVEKTLIWPGRSWWDNHR